jgi:hypothetical protein
MSTAVDHRVLIWLTSGLECQERAREVRVIQSERGGYDGAE